MSAVGTRRWGAVATALILGVGSVEADQTVAEALHRGAVEALAARDPAKAEKLWREAIQEDQAYAPARWALADALLQQGEPARGIAELRALNEVADKAPDVARDWPAEVARARKRLAELSAIAAAVDARVDKYVTQAMALASKWVTKDPELARRLWSRVLRLRPGHVDATALLATLGDQMGTVQALFNGRDSEGWVGWSSEYSVRDGVIVGDHKGHGSALYTEARFTGDVDFRVEGRLAEGYDEPTMFALMAIYDANDGTSFGVIRANTLVIEEHAPGLHEVPLETPCEALSPVLDPHAWNRFELRYRGARVEAWLNGRKVGDFPRRRPTDRMSLALRFQNAKAEFRKVEVRKL